VTVKGVPVNVGDAKGAFKPNALLIIVAKLGSLPNAVANSFNVFNVIGADAIKFANSVLTYWLLLIEWY
jgi:hypothetical protein